MDDEPDLLAQVTVTLPYGGSMTLADVVKGWVSRFANEQPPDSGWWWLRLPRTGPAREEMDQVRP